MSRWTSLLLTAAVTAAPLPATAANPMGTLLREVVDAQGRGDHEQAAQQAAAGSRRSDLRSSERYHLASLARESYEQAFAQDGDPRHLCELRTLLAEANDLAADEAGRSETRAARTATNVKLADIAASGGQVPCTIEATLAAAAGAPPAATTTKDGASQLTPISPRGAISPAPDDGEPGEQGKLRRSPARIGAGAGLLVFSAGLGAGTAAAIWARDREEDTLKAMAAELKMEARYETQREHIEKEAANARYHRFMGLGVALGTMAGISALTAVILLAVPPKSRLGAQARVRPASGGIRVAF